MAVILCYFTEFGSFEASCVKVVEVRLMLSAKMLFKESSFWQYMIYGDILRGF